MSDNLILEVELREPGSSNEAKRLRAAGKIPAVLYGGTREPRTISVSPRSVIEILRSEAGQNTILSLKVADGPEQTALIHDYQVDPLSHRLVHADFKRIDMKIAVEVDVPIETIGEPVGVKVDKGIMDLVTRELHVRCLPGDIPDSFPLDVSCRGSR
jgi:large subunit ribosomal protein L25